MDKWDYNWPKDERGNRKSISDFSDIEKVRYQVYMARLECTLDGDRYIGEEILYLHNWYCYFDLLTKAGDFDPESLKYLHLEIVRLYKERVGWH
jgi:hypothetical protein